MPQKHTIPSCYPYLAAAWILLCTAQPLAAQDSIIIPCDSNSVAGTYCYTDDDDHTWSWQSACGLPLTLQFLSGTIEANMYDVLRIYDGMDNTAPLAFENGDQDMDLAGISIIGSSGSLHMEMTSNDTISCATIDGLRSISEWNWTVTAGTGTAGLGEAIHMKNPVLYPNPATDRVHIRMPRPGAGPMDIRVVDSAGRTVQHQRKSTCTSFLDLDVHGLQPGHYTVVLSTLAWSKALALQLTP